ncbi:MAG: type II toxin-antitoxin system RelE/ParE family toxin [Gammaproteobacteria bacterium]|jgi:putative addiction module killer protein|nr:type II toxin-antitoxin system RelE/ParE family toxin [Gammaproteobacteria bacterium]MBT3893753.1 type II toxin-antitoxin system RelE/ParE family toxin [Gammaproteobacteria bacterium]MBT4788273.1 type II toxin-antitoxin system RelE/ParE family toxin [Gammaproteobacteria bacterium]MBT6880131.1 type II toxin-antitoxin system RelE/ParE family toxin [Gammaproteobacteria bacterium]MBT7479641.1 type II toxin-antitoxin system RelE/ParE family toxin [Gammaproteobacteria bacterium]
MNYEIRRTHVFDKWLKKVRDRQAVKAILQRIDRAILGNFGDSKLVGEEVSEMRIFVGKGYRLYYTMEGERVIVLLCGGTKSNKSAQRADIEQANRLAAELE